MLETLKQVSRRSTLLGLLVGCVVLLGPSPDSAEAYERTWQFLTTGNGHGFQVFDRQAGRITLFLEAPYRYLAPDDDRRRGGVGRRDLAHDIYFGVRAGGTTTWLHDLRSPKYDNQTHIITASSLQNEVRTDVYFFAPFGYEGNGMVMLIKATNQGRANQTVSLFSKPNLKLSQGGDRVEPADGNETIRWNGSADPPHGIETGPAGGHVIYVPIGGVDQVACGGDADVYNRARDTGNIGNTHNCNGNAQVLVTQRDVSLAANESAWWGQAILFLNDDPRDAQANDFKDRRSVSDILALWKAHAGDKDAETIYREAHEEFEGWRTRPPVLDRLNDVERKVWRQSEAVLRMGQIREARQPNRRNHGMYLAALPVGEWHTGWVRDATYAIASIAMAGHHDETRRAVEFFLAAEAGFFDDDHHLGQPNGRPYRVSACRYYGNGLEEGDFNYFGANVETDGWGLVLWSARQYVSYSCDLDWLDSRTAENEKVIDVLLKIAEDIEGQLAANNLSKPDCSIWETHWEYRTVFTYTVGAQIKGLFDFAAIARGWGQRVEDDDWVRMGDHYHEVATLMLEATRQSLVNQADSLVSHMGVVSRPEYRDGSVAELLSWDLFEPSDPVFRSTLREFQPLITGCGGYRRLEEGLSLVGEATANEYDLSEWVLLDLRIGEAWRRAGDARRADELLNKVTDLAAVNDNLVPELLDPDNCDYAGVVPMVGYGAGAWQMAQLEKHGFRPPHYDDNMDHCGVCVADCAGRQCGKDGCEGECGQCDGGAICNADGQCVSVENCGNEVCDEEEDCASCAADCGECCGDGECSSAQDEFCGTCAADCACVGGERCDNSSRTCVPDDPVGGVGGGGDDGPVGGSGAGGGSDVDVPSDRSYSGDEAAMCSSSPVSRSNPWRLMWVLVPVGLIALRRKNRNAH